MKNSIKKNTGIAKLIIVFILLASAQCLQAQTLYKVAANKDVVIKVLGSSNVHDWTMTSGTMESQGEFKFEGDDLKALTGFSFSLDARSLKSEHSSMDDRTYKTIKADQFPKIVFKLTSAIVTPIQKGKFLIKAKGDLTIAGATQNIVIDVTAVVNADSTITCTGSQKLQLKDYKIDPPSFMLGTMKVTNDLTIQFNILYKKQSVLSSNNQ